MKKKIDRSFDGIAAKFAKNIYNSTKGQLRQAVLLRDLAELDVLSSPCSILDVGAGQGQLSLALAAKGHEVLLTDISKEMLDMAQESAKGQQLNNVSFLHSGLADLVKTHEKRYSLILCHAMLEWLAEPSEAILQLKQLLAPKGLLSLMFYNKDAKRFANMVFGNFDYVAADLEVKKKVSLNPQHPLVPSDVVRWCEEAGFSVIMKTGVRCFHDYLKDKSLQQSAFDQLLELELQFNRTEPYASLGRYQHLVLQAD